MTGSVKYQHLTKGRVPYILCASVLTTFFNLFRCRSVISRSLSPRMARPQTADREKACKVEGTYRYTEYAIASRKWVVHQLGGLGEVLRTPQRHDSPCYRSSHNVSDLCNSEISKLSWNHNLRCSFRNIQSTVSILSQLTPTSTCLLYLKTISMPPSMLTSKLISYIQVYRRKFCMHFSYLSNTTHNTIFSSDVMEWVSLKNYFMYMTS